MSKIWNSSITAVISLGKHRLLTIILDIVFSYLGSWWVCAVRSGKERYFGPWGGKLRFGQYLNDNCARRKIFLQEEKLFCLLWCIVVSCCPQSLVIRGSQCLGKIPCPLNFTTQWFSWIWCTFVKPLIPEHWSEVNWVKAKCYSVSFLKSFWFSWKNEWKIPWTIITESKIGSCPCREKCTHYNFTVWTI